MRNTRGDSFWSNMPLFVAGAAIGLKFADSDQYFSWLPFAIVDHRSILTPGIALALSRHFTKSSR
jgi:hypothetical protein